VFEIKQVKTHPKVEQDPFIRSSTHLPSRGVNIHPLSYTFVQSWCKYSSTQLHICPVVM